MAPLARCRVRVHARYTRLREGVHEVIFHLLRARAEVDERRHPHHRDVVLDHVHAEVVLAQPIQRRLIDERQHEQPEVVGEGAPSKG